jgi:cytoskeletal protein CcmA (bactofilin family)
LPDPYRPDPSKPAAPATPATTIGSGTTVTGTSTAVIGKGMVIKGSIHSKQDLLVDGEIDGSLVVEGCKLTIGPHGKAKANASAREIDILGSVTGNVDCTGKTFIRATGQLIGDVRTSGIVIENGAGFRGKVEIVTPVAMAKTTGSS